MNVCSISHVHLNFLNYVCFKDSLEFSPPRIHSPYYHIDDTCNPYAKDEKLFLETFQKHYNYPPKVRKNRLWRRKCWEENFCASICQLGVGGGGQVNLVSESLFL